MEIELSTLNAAAGPGRGSSVGPSLPAQLKILYVTTAARPGRRLAETFAADSATKATVIEAQGPAAGLEQLGLQAFDVVLVVHCLPEIDALSLVEGLRAGGMEEPALILGHDDTASMAPLAYEVGADAYLCVNSTTTRELLWSIARATPAHGGSPINPKPF